MRRPYLRNDISTSITRYNYPITSFAGLDAQTNPDSLPLNYGVYGYNISFRNGVLCNGAGIEYPSFNGDSFPDIMIEASKVRNLFFYKHFDYVNGVKSDRVMAYLGNRTVYNGYLSSERFAAIEGFTFNSNNVTFLNCYYSDSDYMIGISDIGEMKLYDGVNVTTVTGCPALSGACVHYGRIFGVVDETSRIYYSATLDPTNWNNSLSEGGYITLTDEGGLIKKIVSFKDNLYIFREYAIHKLTAYNDQTEFSMSKVYISNNQIYPESVAVCNDKIAFLADDGFYIFDGYTCTKVLRGIFPILSDNRYSVGCYFNHKYYLATKMVVDDEIVGDEKFTNYPMKNNAVIIYDLDLGEVSILRGADIMGFMPVSIENINKLFVYFNNTPKMYTIGQFTDTGKFFNTALQKKWQSPVTNFEKMNKDKVLKKLYITSTAPIKLTTSLDADYQFELYASNRAQMVPVNKRADKIGLAIETSENTFSVGGLLLEFDLIRRNVNE